VLKVNGYSIEFYVLLCSAVVKAISFNIKYHTPQGFNSSWSRNHIFLWSSNRDPILY